MKFGIVMYAGIDPRTITEVAHQADEAGWDGFFIWDAFLSDNAWVILGAAAMVTQHIRLGTMVTAPSRRRPWQLSSEVATLDRLSNGRAILPMALGAAEDLGFGKVGEETDRKIRAELLDESIQILSGLWSGKPFTFAGKHYKINQATFTPTPLQQPRVPLWVVGAWPYPKSMRRAYQCDGVLPIKMHAPGKFATVTPDDVRVIQAEVAVQRTLQTPFDIIFENDIANETHSATAARAEQYADAGTTWWLESTILHRKGGIKGLLKYIKDGPPRNASIS